MAIVFYEAIKIIEVEAPAIEVSIQELLNACREWEDDLSSLDTPQIAYASGKEVLGGGMSVGVTLLLMDWRVRFQARPGPDWVTCNISGGNLVAFNTILQAYVSPIASSPFITATYAASSSATTTLVEQDLSELAGLVANEVWSDPYGPALMMIQTILRNKMITDPVTGLLSIYDDNGILLVQAQLYEDNLGIQKYRGDGAARRERLVEP